jgi:hypothetical protein
VALVRINVSEERSVSIIRVTILGELRTTLAVTINRIMLHVVPSSSIVVTLMMEVIRSPETSVLIRATWHITPEGSILHIHRRENLRCYIINSAELSTTREATNYAAIR